MNVVVHGNVAYLPGSQSAVWFSPPSAQLNSAFEGKSGKAANSGTVSKVAKLTKELDIAPWGADNRFPQNVTNQMEFCGVGKATLDWKARALWGNGLFYGKVDGFDDNNNEIFKAAAPGDFPEVDEFFEENNGLIRFYFEFNQDWQWFANCFPEIVLSKDGKKIRRLVHQESCDCRFKQMDDQGRINRVYLSKLWGATSDQYVKFKPKEVVTGSSVNQTPRMVDNIYVKELISLDMYNAYDDLVTQLETYKDKRNFILPVQYPSPNKTYYQLPVWDGARMAGWVEIVAKIPAMMKAMYEKAFVIKYHIEIPEDYMEKRYGAESWTNFNPEEKDLKKKEMLAEMDKWLSGAENAYKTFISFFDKTIDGKENLNRIKINVVENKSTIDKDLIASSAGNSEIMFSMQTNPALIGAGTPGSNSGTAGSGSDIREGYLVYTSLLHQERAMILEPLLLVKKFNKWPKELVFRFRDVVLTTTDKGKGTEKKVS